MGLCPSKNRARFKGEKEINPVIILQKLKLLQKEIKVVLKQREEEREAYEREAMMFVFKEADWRKEKQRLRDKVRRLRRKMTMSSVESGSVVSLFVVEKMREERDKRDEAVEKWKMLYLDIKNELDDLIQKTHQQGTLYWRGEEEEMMQKELKAKDETIQVLKAKIASMEEEDIKRRREVDILKQSLKIVCSKKETINTSTSLVKA